MVTVQCVCLASNGGLGCTPAHTALGSSKIEGKPFMIFIYAQFG